MDRLVLAKRGDLLLWEMRWLFVLPDAEALGRVLLPVVWGAKRSA